MSLGLTDPGLVSCRLGDEGGYRPYFENYTVDASILDSTERSDHINNDDSSTAFGVLRKFIGQSQHFGVAIDSLYSCDNQFSKSKRWMPWHLEPKKDV